MKRLLRLKHQTRVRATATEATRWWHVLPLLALLLSGPSVWAQTYIIGANQTTCAGTIYDSGGATGTYQNNEDLTSVITPGTAGSKVRLTFSVFTVETCCDNLKIYDGPTASAPLIGTYTASPGVITATNTTGQLTLVFHSDVSITYDGFAADIACVTNVPNIASFTPTTGPAATSVVITGSFFTGATAVTFNGIAATSFIVNSATQITAVVPAAATTGPIRVTTPIAVATSGTNFVVPAPAVTSFTPTSGLPGTVVVITGTVLGAATGVTFNGTAATAFTVNSATQITATVPTGATTGPIRVITPSLTAVSTTNFTVPAPTVTSFTPTTGAAGTSVVVTGTNFVGVTAVTLGGTAVSAFTINSATQITAIVPANAYTGSVCVTTPAGTGCSTGTYDTGNAAYLIGTNVTTCSGNIFDSGGPTGNYQNSEDLTSVLTPANGSKVVLTFTSFTLETCCDNLKIYDGPSASSPLIGTYATTSPGTITASTANTSGQLTLVFHSDGSVVYAGFAAAISCLAPPTCTLVTNLTVSGITPTSAMLNFTPGIGNNSYVVTYTAAGGTAQTATGTSSPITLTNLTPATAYAISVQPICTVGTSANTLTNTNFTTLLPNDDAIGAITVPVTANCTSPTAASNLGATTSPTNGYNLPGCSSAQSPKDVWYKFTTPATGATATSVQINVTGNPAGQVRVFSTTNAGAGPFTQLACAASAGSNLVAPNLTVTGLTASATYYVSVSGYGSGDTDGAFTICVTTAQTPVTALVVSSITNSSASINFTAPTGATSYTVTYTPTNGASVTITSTTLPINLTGLVPNLGYTVSVVANFPGGATSPATTTTFTTLQATASRTAIGNGTLSVYPNPAQRSFVLTLPALSGVRTAQVTLLNSLGQQVQTRTVSLNLSGTEVPMEATGLAAGIYTLRVKAGSQVATAKVVINN